jgi:hypothetical protein
VLTLIIFHHLTKAFVSGFMAVVVQPGRDRRDARMLNFLFTVTNERLFEMHHYQRACCTDIEILDLVWQH